MLLHGIMSRIFQHELDHLDGETMWEEKNEKSSKVPRRLERLIPIEEIEADIDKFYLENQKFIL